MRALKKKPSSVGKRYLGRQLKFGHPVAGRNYTKARHFVPTVLPSPADFYEAEIDGFIEYNDDWAWGCCPFHDDNSPSFCMNLRTGWYQCKSSHCGETGKSIVSFVSARDGLSKADAIRYLEGWA
jgi:hypothetical protein